MAAVVADMSSDTLSSLHELSVELTSLGLKPSINHTSSSPVELCKGLLNSAWMLINLIHSRSMGLNNSSQTSSERECFLRSENQSLEVKLESLKKDVASKDEMLAKEVNNVYKLQGEIKTQNLKIQKQKHVITQLTDKLRSHEKDFQHEVLRLEAQCEQLREMVRKSLGMGSRPILGGTVEDKLATLDVSDISTENHDRLITTLNRLKSSNSGLIQENLTLRDALQLLHQDIQQVLGLSKHSAATSSNLALEAFRLPVEFSLKQLKKLRQDQIKMLHEIIAYKHQ